ncbi:unnamed protein product [Adineta steineri]|uniref:DUF5672 domain-containing protein n=1 Tax=Adineta steineri TaxID=433720 RepID=A0A814Z7G3_9BILA|nr:unnamed protein product [Adineta steineri]CAF1238586.1 unnamed protein product [Adineta steineri]
MQLILNKSCISKRSLLLVIFCACLLSIIVYTNFINISPYSFNISHNYTSKYPYIALIVDDRATQLLVNAVINVLQHIPIDWKVQIMTPYQHWLFYNKSSLSSLIQTNRVFLTPLEQTQNGLSSDEFINSILTSVSFWHQVQGDKVLFFQIDSVLCSNSLYNLTDFLQYDFIGAPWYIGGCCNGGLSIRNRQKILQMLESGHIHYRLHELNEDGWFTKNLPYFNGYVAPISIAKRFAVETIYHSRPFAVHKPHTSTIGRTNMKHLCNECPEVNTITSYCQTFK